jgi:hypothetical protein
MKKLASYLVSLTLMAFCALGQTTISQAITGGTVANLLDEGGVLVDSITFTASTSTNTTVKLYDSSTTSTNYVVAAYSRYASYATNFDSVFTNAEGVLVTNTFSGRWTYPTSVSASTNERPKVLNFVVPGSGQRTKDTLWTPARGITILADQDGIVEVTYRKQQ